MGKFLACPGYPDCKGTKPLLATADGSIKAGKVIVSIDEACEKCVQAHAGEDGGARALPSPARAIRSAKTTKAAE